MKAGKKLFIGLCSYLLQTYAWGSDIESLPGNISFQGEMLTATCMIDATSKDIWVDFGEISAREITPSPGKSAIRNFKIKLSGCPDAENSVSIKFTGDTTKEDKRLFSVYGKAAGFGILLKDSAGNEIYPGENISNIGVTGNNEEIKFTASLVSFNHSVKAGEFYAIAQFSLDYL